MAGPALTNPVTGGLPAGAAPHRAWRDLWAIDTRPRIVSRAQCTAGRAVLLAAFALAAQALGLSLPYVAAAAAFAYLPAWRHAILLVAAAVALARSTGIWLQGLDPVLLQEGVPAATARLLVLGALAVYFIGAWAVLARLRRNPGWLLARRPVPVLLGATALLCALASLPVLHGTARVAAWAGLYVFAAYLWYFAYAVQDQRSRTPAPLPFQMGILHPFWRAIGSSPTPFGKGAAFLRKHQAKSAEELAVTQLKALKLLVWALLLTGLQRLLVDGLEVRLGIPPTAAVYEAFLRGQPMPLALSWASLVWATLGGALSLAIWGHKIIAVARLAGFRLPRNTWRPLQARTLAEFWNRYYYYFKELLVEFFFFPTFLRSFRKHPRLRVFFATFMAAGVGNALYHFIRDLHHVAALGWREASVGFTSYLFYCAVLATGIGISQARITGGRKLPSGRAGTVWSVLCVWSFFVGLQVFGDETRSFPFTERVAFFFALFGIG